MRSENFFFVSSGMTSEDAFGLGICKKCTLKDVKEAKEAKKRIQLFEYSIIRVIGFLGFFKQLSGLRSEASLQGFVLPGYLLSVFPRELFQ